MTEQESRAAAANPVLVERRRGDAVESVHRGAFAVVDSAGGLRQSGGDIATPIYPRSAVKPLQALVMLESGAAERFAVSEAEIALACSSHGATPAHVGAVAAWLARMGLGPDDLGCGADAPSDVAAATALDRAGEAPGRLHNNCSGKHSGFLAAALHLGAPHDTYLRPDHPVQQWVAGVLADFGDCEPSAAPIGVDGCGVPTWGLPLAAIARAAATLARPDRLGAGRAAAARRAIAAMTAHPTMVGGPGRFDTVVMAAGAGAVAVKGGAEGVQFAVLPGLGLGIAVKIDDGAKAPAEVAMAALLARHGGLDDPVLAALAPWRNGLVRNTLGATVGTVRAVGDLV